MNSLWVDILRSLTETLLSLHTSQYWRSLIIVLLISQDLLLSFFFKSQAQFTNCALHSSYVFKRSKWKNPSCFHQVSSYPQVLCHLLLFNNQFPKSHSFLHSDHSTVQLLSCIPRWPRFSWFILTQTLHIHICRHRHS